jgi:tetratricopeptide (TPR) repeat protein
MLIALAAAAMGCASADRPARRDTSREHFALPVARAGSQAEAADLFGYRAGRERLVLLLGEEGDPSEQAGLAMELADLAERTRGTALVRMDELESRRDDGAREERDELGRLVRELLDEELKRLESVARDFPDYPRRDEALYRLGCALLERDRPDVALKFLRALFAEYPSSPYTPHGYLAFGDHFFEQEKIDEAVKVYEKVLAFESPDAAPLAHFKLGWCWHERGEHRRSLDSFVDAAGAAKRLGGPIGNALQDEALRDLVRAYVHVGVPERALELFSRVDEGRIDEMLERLGAAYFDAGRFPESIVINRQVSARVECSPVQARAQVAVFEARLYLGEIGDLKAEGEALVEVFTRLAQCVDSEDLVEFAAAGAAARETLKAQARRYRDEFETSGEPAAAEMAADLELMAESF